MRGISAGRLAARRPSFTASTRSALVTVATELFSERGYAGTSLDEIVAGAKVTKGALYHHFKGKQDLFEAVFVSVEGQAAESIRKRIRSARDPYAKAVAGLNEFLAVTRSDAYSRIVVQDGPAVLGYERYREQEERTTFGLVRDIVAELLASYEVPEPTMRAVTRLFFGALTAIGAEVSHADDADRASADAEAAIVLVLAGIRAVLSGGAPEQTFEGWLRVEGITSPPD